MSRPMMQKNVRQNVRNLLDANHPHPVVYKFMLWALDDLDELDRELRLAKTRSEAFEEVVKILTKCIKSQDALLREIQTQPSEEKPRNESPP